MNLYRILKGGFSDGSNCINEEYVSKFNSVWCNEQTNWLRNPH